jgi:glycosyltransferase involved in cell wall biosynthesis
MQIIVNTRLLLNGKLDGIGRFTHETLSRVVKMHPDWHFIFLFDRPHDEQFIYADNVTPIELFPPARHTVLIHWYYQWSVKKLLKQFKPDLFYTPDAHGVINPPCKQLITIHDINFEHYPEDLPLKYRYYLPYITSKYVHSKHTHLNTVSAFSRQDMAQKYHLNEAAISIIGNGVNDNFTPLSDADKQATRLIFSDGQPYYFFVGSIHPRKNLVNMIKAFDAFKRETKGTHKFLISGSGWSQKDIKTMFSGTAFIDDVVYLGRIKDVYLPQLIGAAEALMYVSKFEGFGIPIIEAFACKTPVITSNVSALPEIAGDAALLALPDDIDQIKNHMLDLLHNSALKQELIRKGFERKQLYSWDIMAEKLSRNFQAIINADV